MTAHAQTSTTSEEDRLRADLYDFLGTLLSAPPRKALLKQAATLGGDDSSLGQAITAMARLASASSEKAVESEFNALFIGLGRGELLPYASYYMTGFLNEKPLSLLRSDMQALRITRAANVFEPEDNIGSLFEMMAGMITGRFGASVSLAQQKEFFAKHIRPWAGHFFKDLMGAENAVFYAAVGAAGQAFMEIEIEAFRMSAQEI